VVTLVVDRDGILYWEDEPVHAGLLGKRLEAVASAREIAVQVRADTTVDYGAVMQVLDTVRRAGIVEVGLVTQPGPSEERETEGR
jgi:biopolymer transport protein ExbD